MLAAWAWLRSGGHAGQHRPVSTVKVGRTSTTRQLRRLGTPRAHGAAPATERSPHSWQSSMLGKSVDLIEGGAKQGVWDLRLETTSDDQLREEEGREDRAAALSVGL